MVAVSRKPNGEMLFELFVREDMCHHIFAYTVAKLIGRVAEVFGCEEKEILQYVTDEINEPTNMVHPERGDGRNYHKKLN